MSTLGFGSWILINCITARSEDAHKHRKIQKEIDLFIYTHNFHRLHEKKAKTNVAAEELWCQL